MGGWTGDHGTACTSALEHEGPWACGDIHFILRQRIDDLSNFRSTAGLEYGQRGESLASGESQEYFSPTIVPSLLL